MPIMSFLSEETPKVLRTMWVVNVMPVLEWIQSCYGQEGERTSVRWFTVVYSRKGYTGGRFIATTPRYAAKKAARKVYGTGTHGGLGVRDQLLHSTADLVLGDVTPDDLAERENGESPMKSVTFCTPRRGALFPFKLQQLDGAA